MRHHLHGAHVNLIEVWSLFAVDFNVHEVFVHQPGDRLVLKRLMLHHMTPVTRRIADAQQDWFLLAARNFQRFFAPRETSQPDCGRAAKDKDWFR